MGTGDPRTLRLGAVHGLRAGCLVTLAMPATLKPVGFPVKAARDLRPGLEAEVFHFDS